MNKKHQFFNWTQPNPTHYKMKNSNPNPTQPNPWVNPTHVHLCMEYEIVGMSTDGLS